MIEEKLIVSDKTVQDFNKDLSTIGYYDECVLEEIDANNPYLYTQLMVDFENSGRNLFFLMAAVKTYELLRLEYRKRGEELPKVSEETIFSFMEKYNDENSGYDFAFELLSEIHLYNENIAKAQIQKCCLTSIARKELLSSGGVVTYKLGPDEPFYFSSEEQLAEFFDAHVNLGMVLVYSLIRHQKDSDDLEKQLSSSFQQQNI